MLGQIADELNRNPTSCFSINTMAWYNALYSAEGVGLSCAYQVSINEELCESEPPSNLEDVIEVILGFVSGSSRRVATVAVRLICRETLRRLALDTAPNN